MSGRSRGRPDGGTQHDDDDEGRGTGESRRVRHAGRSAPPRQAAAQPRAGRRLRGGGRRRAGAQGDAPRGPAAEADADRRRRADGGAHRARARTSSWSYPGGVILPIYDILGDYPEIRHILVRHEQGGGHAADGYARASGKVGVCMGTERPGRDEPRHRRSPRRSSTAIPMVAITGNVPNALIGKDAFQEIDITGITLPMTKHNYLVRNADDIPHVVAEAFYLASHGRPGPVHIDITKDALQQETTAEHPSLDDVIAGLPGFRPNARGPPQAAQAGRPGDRRGEASADPRRARRPHRGRDGTSSRRSPRRPRSPSRGRCSGIGAIDEEHPLALRLHGHARLEARQPRDPVGRPPDRDRDAVRRPGHRQRPHLRAVRPDHPRRHRPGRDRQERRGRGADRRRREARPARA